MKLHTRHEIVDGVKGEVRYVIYRGNDYVCGFSESEAKELYELLKERFEKLSPSTD